MFVLMAGCSPTFQYGAMPKVDGLGALKPGTSTVSEVRQALGEPRGYGKAKLNPDFPLRDVWFYEYTEGKGKKIGLDILLVFINKDAYDGYLWFSSAQLLEAR